MTVEEAMKRIKNRAKEEGRFFEENIPESYLKQLVEKYDELYKNREDRVKIERFDNLFDKCLGNPCLLNFCIKAPPEDAIEIDSNQPRDEIVREVADKLQNNRAKYCQVLEHKGFPRENASEVLDLMISCFKNSWALGVKTPKVWLQDLYSVVCSIVFYLVFYLIVL